MVGGICFQFDASYHAFHPILANRTGASFKFEPRSLQQRWLHKKYIFGTATSYHGLKVVLSKEFAEHENEAVKL